MDRPAVVALALAALALSACSSTRAWIERKTYDEAGRILSESDRTRYKTTTIGGDEERGYTVRAEDRKTGFFEILVLPTYFVLDLPPGMEAGRTYDFERYGGSIGVYGILGGVQTETGRVRVDSWDPSTRSLSASFEAWSTREQDGRTVRVVRTGEVETD
jgi:hypothetical protein